VLTKREAEICGLLRRRASNKHLARAAHITEDAVKFHLKNIYRKLGVHSRSEALAILDAQRQE
jgi:LuxR family maltose regulon positive regulatory protein